MSKAEEFTLNPRIDYGVLLLFGTFSLILSGLLEIANDDFEHIMVWFKHHAYDYVANSSKRIISEKEGYSAYKRLKKYFDKKPLT